MTGALLNSSEVSLERRDCDCCGKEQAVTKSFEEEDHVYGSEQDRVTLPVTIPVWTCQVCDEAFTDWEADEIRHEAVCAYLDRPSPRMIRGFRDANGLTQEHLARLSRFGIASIKRWESGEQIPTASAAQHLQLIMRPGTLGYLLKRDKSRQNLSAKPIFRTEINDFARRQASKFELRPSEVRNPHQSLVAA